MPPEMNQYTMIGGIREGPAYNMSFSEGTSRLLLDEASYTSLTLDVALSGLITGWWGRQ